MVLPAIYYKDKGYNSGMQIGSWKLPHQVFVAPMAGVTDRPYRRLCKAMGAAYAVSEMAASNPQLWDSLKTSRRLDHTGEPDPIAVQITGADPDIMAQAALFNIKKGAQIIDINMGCPAKKVCNVASGSALLRDEDLIAKILEKVVNTCLPLGIAVTLKTRTGWDRANKNAVRIAKLAENCGISALTIHGRTRCDFYTGTAEYETIRAIRQNIKIPLIANGDIDTPEKAKYVLDYTGADAIMIGRAAQGKPWIFREIAHYLEFGKHLAAPTYGELHDLLLEHLEDHYNFYGEQTGVRTARKHISWYLKDLPDSTDFIQNIMQLNSTIEQTDSIGLWFSHKPKNELITA